MTGSTFAHEQDRGYLALRRLPGALQALPGWQALVKGLSVGSQALEDDIWSMTDESISTAMGGFLDQWGQLVGESRGALVDADYRRFVRARIRSNYSTGTSDDLIDVLRISSNALAVRQIDKYPAHTTLIALRQTFMATPVADRVVRIMRETKAAGVSITIKEATPAPIGAGPSAVFDLGGVSIGVISRQLYP